MRKILLIPTILAGVAVTASAAFVAGVKANPSPPSAGPAVATSTVKVVRRDLVERQAFNATLGYGTVTTVTNRISGTITAEAALGSTVDRGQRLYGVDGRAVLLMIGSFPAYRELKAGVSEGEDVKQLQENLVALGFASSANLAVDGHFDAWTTAAVMRWQKSIGVSQDGTIPFGQVLFQPAAVRIAAWKAVVGDQAGPGGPIVDMTGIRHVVTLDLDARRQSLATAGAAVSVTLADGSVASGHISEVGKVAAQAAGGGQPTIKVYATLDDPRAGGSVDQAPVSVGLARGSRTGVLAVPVNALLARPDGTYALEVERQGRREQVVVTTGLFAEGVVEVTGAGLSEGMAVVVPAS